MKLQFDDAVRPAAVAGMFYPGDAPALKREVAAYLAQSGGASLETGFPKLLIVPHAGYIYSGPVAAHAYRLLGSARGIVHRVVLLGPCHRVAVRGLALPGATSFETPLGRIAVDSQAVAAIRDLPQIVISPAAHAEEHALEVQLPFLQQALGEFSLLPLAVGDVAPEKVAEVIERLWGGPETLFIISSDLSHYHPYEVARRVDRETVRSILGFNTDIAHVQACGATPIAGALIAAKRHGLAPKLLDCRNSGDTAGDKERVVGYASFAFMPENDEGRFGIEHGGTLLKIARAAIGAALGIESPMPATDESWLKQWRATFVTLTQDEELRGCVGSLEARRSLAEDVAANARAAAFQDTRFDPLTGAEFARTGIEVSLLSEPKAIEFSSYKDLIAQLRPGVDGIILEHGDLRATFLPQVWESLADPEQFIAHLKQKAGIPQRVSAERCRIQRYTVIKWREADRP